MNQNEILEEDIDFLTYIGAEVVSLDDGYAKLALKVQPHHKQHLGVVHGGAIATLADHTGWYAVMSQLEKEYTSVTIEIKINYLKAATGNILRAEAKVINKTKRTAFATIELFSQDILVAYATGTYAILTERK